MYFLAIIIIAVIVLVGVVMYATFHDCDPLLTGKITNSNQVSRVCMIPKNYTDVHCKHVLKCMSSFRLFLIFMYTVKYAMSPTLSSFRLFLCYVHCNQTLYPSLCPLSNWPHVCDAHCKISTNTQLCPLTNCFLFVMYIINEQYSQIYILFQIAPCL